MGKKSREKRAKYASGEQQTTYSALPAKKKGLSNAKKVLIGLSLIAVIVVAASIALSSLPPQEGQGQTPDGYPRSVSPATYTLAEVSSDGSEVTVPLSEVNSSKLVFVDLKLKTTQQTLEYQGRTVPLASYRGGEYLPLVLISTPSGNTVAGIRTCEPCISFSFHIVSGSNLKCDACGTEWLLEDFAPVPGGGCTAYPPPKLSTTVNGGSVAVDLSALNLQFV